MAKDKKINLKPMAGYVLIEPQGATEKTESGIYLPDSANEKPQKGKVIAVGDEEITDSGLKKKVPVKVGEVVLYKKWGGSEIKENGIEYLFAKFDDILAVVVN